jgi:hypothetical protein
MQAATDAEVLKSLTDNQWMQYVRADGTTLYYADSAANCIELTYPETPLRISYIVRVASMLGLSDESLFYGALLWVTDSTIGSPQLVKGGWKLVEKMRQGYGENRPLQAASGHFFRDDELVDLAAFPVPCFVFGWDAYLVPHASNDFFVHISHDESWGIVARTEEAYGRLFSELKNLNPKESSRMRKRFCRTTSAKS